MHTTKTIQNFNDTELKKLVPQGASWHEEVSSVMLKDYGDCSLKTVHTYLLAD